MSKYLSMDCEATGLHEGTLLTQIAFVPLDLDSEKVFHHLGMELLVKCPTYEELEPSLDEWNKKHNKELIIHANREGLTREELQARIEEYFSSDDFKAIFGNDRPVLLGKSMCALDIPLIRRNLGWEFIGKKVHHHTLDVTAVARALVDAGVLPPNCSSSSKLIKHFGIRDETKHTALSDAVDMAEIYLRMVKLLKEAKGGPEKDS